MQRGVARFLVCAFFALCFLASFVSAADYSCPVTQQLFRISSQTNAHAEAFNGAGNYLTHICYDDYFGNFTGTRDASCDPSNPAFLRLTGFTNAHAEDPALLTSGYVNDICFNSQLSCVYQTATIACSEEMVEVASFSGRTNAHVGIPGTYLGSGAYRLCCGVGTSILTGNFSQVQWRNNAGTAIGRSFSTNSSLNWTVRMWTQTGFPVGTNVTFELWEDDSFVDDHIRDFTVLTTNGGAGSVGDVAFRIQDSDITAGGAYSFGDEDDGESFEEFYFKVKTTTGISSEVVTSSVLDVALSAAPNSPPDARIIAPRHRGIYYNGTTVEFRQTGSDLEGDLLTVLWTIAEDGFSTSNATFNYTFKSAGEKTITLQLTDSAGSRDEDQIGVLVLASPGIFAFIGEPKHQALIVNRSLTVRLSANDSYVVNSQGSCPGLTLTCIAGVCPSQTENAPLGCASPLTVAATPQGFNRLYFDWGFSDGDTAPSVDGLGAVSLQKQFGLASASLTDYKRADLRLNYTNSTFPGGALSLQQIVSRSFTLLDARQCVNNGASWVEYDSDSGAIIRSWPTSGANNRCTGYDGLAGNGDDCCPARHTCTGTPATCVPVNESRCSDYQSRNACRDDVFNVVETDPSWDNDCERGYSSNGTIISCSCEWTNTTITSGPYCLFSKEYQRGSRNSTDPSCTPHRCNYLPTSAPTACVNGYASVTVQAQFVNGTCPIPVGAESSCLAGTGTRTVLCGRPSISLDFFGPLQFGITLAFILIMYGVWSFRKRR